MAAGSSPPPYQDEAAPPPTEHINIKVTDGSNEVFFKIKRSTPLKKLMDAFCDRQGKDPKSVRFLYDGDRVQPGDNPDTVSFYNPLSIVFSPSDCLSHWLYPLAIYYEIEIHLFAL
jgi:hypothetical protein